MRFTWFASMVAGAAGGGLLLGAVATATHLELVGACMGVTLGAVVGAGLWSGSVSVLTVGGIVGAAFASTAGCTPTGMVAPIGFLMGYGVTYVLRGICRALFSLERRRRGLTWLWLGWMTSVILWRNGTISGLVPAYSIIFLLAFESGADSISNLRLAPDQRIATDNSDDI